MEKSSASDGRFGAFVGPHGRSLRSDLCLIQFRVVKLEHRGHRRCLWTPNPLWEESGFLGCILIRLAWLLVGKMRIEVFAAHQQTPLRAYYEICLGAPSQLKNSSNFRRLTEGSEAACLSWLSWSMVATHHQQNNKYESLTACSRWVPSPRNSWRINDMWILAVGSILMWSYIIYVFVMIIYTYIYIYWSYLGYTLDWHRGTELHKQCTGIFTSPRCFLHSGLWDGQRTE